MQVPIRSCIALLASAWKLPPAEHTDPGFLGTLQLPASCIALNCCRCSNLAALCLVVPAGPHHRGPELPGGRAPQDHHPGKSWNPSGLVVLGAVGSERFACSRRVWSLAKSHVGQRGCEAPRIFLGASFSQVAATSAAHPCPPAVPTLSAAQGGAGACKRAALMIRELINGEPGSAQAIIQRVCAEVRSKLEMGPAVVDMSLGGMHLRVARPSCRRTVMCCAGLLCSRCRLLCMLVRFSCSPLPTRAERLLNLPRPRAPPTPPPAAARHWRHARDVLPQGHCGPHHRAHGRHHQAAAAGDGCVQSV